MLKVISEESVKAVINRPLALRAAERAFLAGVSGHAEIFPVAFGSGMQADEMFAIKSGLSGDDQLIGIKVGSYWPGNAAKQLPNHGSTILLLDPVNGFPYALINAGLLNGYRTAAADALAVQRLSNPDADILGVIGAGHQAEYDIRAIAEVRQLKLVKIWSRSTESAGKLCRKLQDLEIEVVAAGLEETVSGSHIVITVTPASEVLLRAEWIAAGTHISAMGADKAGKQELDPELFRNARCYADYPEQSVKIGEFQHGIKSGSIENREGITAIGDVLNGRCAGRTDERQVTVFDSSGIALQDIYIADEIVSAVNAASQPVAVAF